MTTSRVVPFFVGIAGGSGSGKTTLSHAIIAALGPERAVRLAHDAYYRDRSDVAADARADLDYDVPEAFDQVRFREDLARLRRGEAIRPPLYCFATHTRLGDGPALAPRDVVVVEGILLLHDPHVRAALDLAVFVDAPDAIRFARRLARDAAERGRTADAVRRQYAATVVPAHVRYVEPTKRVADLVLRSESHVEPLVEVMVTLISARLRLRQEVPHGVRAHSA